MLIYGYKFYSAGAKALARAIPMKRIKYNSTTFRGRRFKKVINWGATELPDEVLKCGKIFNHPEHVVETSNKRTFFEILDGMELTPEFTTDKEEAIEWVNNGITVVCRKVLAGHSGAGIIIADTAQAVVDAPLYVAYIKKKEEYRVHIANGNVFDVQRKVRRADAKIKDWRVRNHATGFVFQRNDLNPPDELEDVALDTMSAFDLDFGAVDIIFNAKEDRCYALEINTAPGLEGTTLANYARELGAWK